MPRNIIAVCSNSTELTARLGLVCPGLTFVPFDTSEDSFPPQVLIIDAGFTSDIPLHGRSRVRIFLDKNATDPRRFGDLRIEKEEFLEAAPEFISFAQDLASTASRALDLEQEVSLFSEVRDLMSLDDASLVFERITQALTEILKLSTGSLYLFDTKAERFAPVYSNETRVASRESVSADLARLIAESPAGKTAVLVRPPEGSAGLVAIPIQIRDELIGFYAAPVPRNADMDDHLTAGAARYLRAMTAVIANVHQITNSKDLAMRDDLTKAYNRRFFESYLDEEIERARRYGSVLSIIFLDLDDLKNVNSRWGHLMGSRVLQEVAKRILSAVRAIDKVVRFGGDEFCIILPQTDQVQAKNVADRVRRALTDSIFKPESDIEIGISASFGIATYPYHAVSKEDLIRQADDAMFRIKSSTKNAIGIAGELHPPPRVSNEAV